MNNETEKSIVKKTENALDDLADLWRRRRWVCVLVLAVVILPTVLSIIIIPNLRSDLEKAEKAKDKAELQLAPFLAAANQAFPQVPEGQRLELLMARLDTAVSKVEDAANRIPQRRALSESSINRISAVLRQGSLFSVHFSLEGMDGDAVDIANGLYRTFRLAEWPIIGPINRRITPVPSRGLQISVSETPPLPVQQALGMVLDELHYPREIVLNTNLPPQTIDIVVGAQ